MKGIAAAIALFLLAAGTKAQTVAGTDFIGGYVINNFTNYRQFPKRTVAFINRIYAGITTNEHEPWAGYYNYPEYGLSIMYGSLGNEKEFGHFAALIPYINFTIRPATSHKLSLISGWGVAYFTKPFDSISNPHNILIGSHLNHMVYMGITYEKELSAALTATIGANYIHSSNGHYQVPNGGINLATITAGLKIKISPHNTTHYPNDTTATKKVKGKSLLYLTTGYGRHELAGTLGPVSTPKYNIYNFSAFYAYRYSIAATAYFGITAKFYDSFYSYIKEHNYYAGQEVMHSFVWTLFAGHEFLFGRIGLFTNAGINVYMPFIRDYVYKNDVVFNINYPWELYISTKMGLRYYFFNPYSHKTNMYISFGIKAHFGNADFTEAAIGVVI